MTCSNLQEANSGVKLEINKASDTKLAVSYEYDMKNVDSNSVFNSHEYWNSNNKFSVNNYKSYYESNYKNRNGKFLITK